MNELEHGHATGWSAWVLPATAGWAQRQTWRWRAWGDHGSEAGIAPTRAEAVELALRAERRLCGPRRVLAALARA
jgi:hypothetical protein